MKKKNIEKNIDSQRKLFALFVLVSVIATLMLGAYFYHYYSMKLISESPYFDQMKNWVDKERAYLKNKNNWESPKRQQTKLISINKENKESAVRFEFYQTLPTMQVMVPGLVNKNNDHESLEEVRHFDDDNTLKLKDVALNGKLSIKKEKKLASSPKFFNAETLKREFAREARIIER